jgi:thymidylate kinase
VIGQPRPRRAVPRRDRGLWIVLAGPDGSGKTAVARALLQAASATGTTLHLHHRPRSLPGVSRQQGPVTEPHRDVPYPPLLSTLKLVYLYLDYLVGWLLRIRPVLRRGGTVILERGWWDLAVDPRRYRLVPLPSLHRWLARLQPSPDRTIVLHAPADVLLQRKAELPQAELERQLEAWRAISATRARCSLMDATRDLRDIVAVALEDVDARWRPGWIGLPRRSSPRWLLPRGPRRTAVASLRIHRPVSIDATAMWSVGYLAASTGSFRLGGVARPSPWVIDRVIDLVPAGGTLATARSNHPGRSHVLVLDASGVPVLMVKVASDESGAAQLAREAAALRRLAPLLPAPVTAPEVHNADTGRLALVAVRWRWQAAPWRMEADVAASLGAFHAHQRGEHGTGLGHGDVAPWNLLRLTGGWCLVDWEEAGEGHLPFADVFHFVVQGHSLLGRPWARTIFRGLAGEGWVADCIRSYAEAAGLDPATSARWFQLYLERSTADLPRSAPSGVGRLDADDRRALRARERLLAKAAKNDGPTQPSSWP